MKARKHLDIRLPHLRIPLWWPDLPGNWRAWLPSRGNVLFTLLVVAGLLWASNAGALPLRAPAAATTSTGTIAYQGRLADADGNPLTGTYNMIFRLYDAATGGVPLWEEQWTGSNGVQVSDGLFNVMLGSLTQIPQSVVTGNSSLWLGITVGTDDEMTPRVQLGSVPFAVQALTVPDGSVTTGKLADGAVTQAKLGPDISLEPPDGSITSAKIADGAVTTTKLADWAVTESKIADGSITPAKLAPALRHKTLTIPMFANGYYHTENWGDGIVLGNSGKAEAIGAIILPDDFPTVNTDVTLRLILNTSSPGSDLFKLRVHVKAQSYGHNNYGDDAFDVWNVEPGLTFTRNGNDCWPSGQRRLWGETRTLNSSYLRPGRWLSIWITRLYDDPEDRFGGDVILRGVLLAYSGSAS